MSAPDMLALRARQLCKAYRGQPVLDGFDVDVPLGEKLALIGPSGSGKSTVLRLVMGLEEPDAGELVILGERDLARARGQVGMVFQQFNLFPHFTVLRNVTEAPRRVLGLSERDARERGEALLARVGLADKLRAHPRELSGGQKQRVAIARALAMRPKVLLLDEVTSALDPELVDEVWSVVRELSHEEEVTMLIVTHQLSVLPDIADRVAFFEQGRIRELGTPEQVLYQPTEARTAEFVRRLRV